MKTKLLLVSTFVTLITCFSSLANAREYAIEVIVFINKQGLRADSERINRQAVINVPNGLQLSGNNNSQWQPIPKNQYILNNVAEKLKRSGNYQILKHIAWRQPVVDKHNSRPIAIQAGRDFTGQFPYHGSQQAEFSDSQMASTNRGKLLELDGTINVTIDRYLHVYTDMVYRSPRSQSQVLVDYPVQSHRKMRSRELHYIDHPVVGILVEATPIE